MERPNPTRALALSAFGLALALQLALNDIPGAFVAPAVVPLAAWLAARHGTRGALPVLAASAGYFVARVLEGTFFRSYGAIADIMALLLHAGSVAVGVVATHAIRAFRTPPEA